MTTSLTRRSALAAFLASVPVMSAAARETDPISAAIRRAVNADAAYRESGRLADAINATGRRLPAALRAHRAALLLDRTSARFDLNALTPTTPAAAVALVAYYRSRADACGEPEAYRAACRRLRKVFRRPGAVACPGAVEINPPAGV